MTTLTVNKLSHYYQDGDYRRYVLKDIQQTFEGGVFYTILGQSGSGKSTLLALMSAMDSVQEGEVLCNGENFKTMGLNNVRRTKVGMVFQSYNLIPYMTAVENVLVAISISQSVAKKEALETAYNLLDYLGITKTKANRRINRLSGGEQQRVAIARALATNVDIILADEPSGNLDTDTEAEIIDIFKKLAHEHGKCVVVVTHSNEVAEHADVVLELKKAVLSIRE